MTKKINAFTLMEVTFAMLLSAICIVICYSAYDLIGSYYKRFREKNELTDRALALSQVLDRDFLKAQTVITTEKGIDVQQERSVVHYRFSEKCIERELEHLHTDSFNLEITMPEYYFEQHAVQPLDTIDKIKFLIKLNKDIVLPIEIHKDYSSYDLYK